MNNKKAWGGLRTACLTTALFAAIGTAALRADPAPVIIGVLNDQSGNYADLGGKGSVVAAQMAVEDYGPTVLGRPIRVIAADHQDKPDIASAIASKWFDEQGVDMITDMTFSSAALSVQHIAEQRHKITIDSGAATSALINEACSPTGFMWAFNTYTEAVATTSAILKQGGDSWAVIAADYAFGQQLATDIKAVLAR
jgi:branched-chain amino acid transport system substrate-binding protein